MPRLISNLSKKQLNSTDQSTWDTYVRKYLHSNSRKSPQSDVICKTSHMSYWLDLHGLTIHQAFVVFKDFLYQHSLLKTKKVKVITGKGGQIHKEFPLWCQDIKYISAVCPVYDSQNQYGSYEIWLKNK